MLYRFLIATLAVMCIIFSTFLQSVLRNLQQGGYFFQGFHNELISKALSSNTFSVFVPVLVGIPFAARYLEEVKSKFVRFYLIRRSYSSYILDRFAVCWLCGGGVALMGCLGAWGMTTLIFTPIERVTENYVSIVPQMTDRLVLLFLNGGLWAVLGMALSTVMESKYIAYASPFIVYYLLVILYERYFPDVWLLSPKNWLTPESWPYEGGSATFFLLELTFLCGLVFYIRGRRRLENL